MNLQITHTEKGNAKDFLTKIEVATANHRSTVGPAAISDLAHAAKENSNGLDCFVFESRKEKC